jgi:hypothetical protein
MEGQDDLTSQVMEMCIDPIKKRAAPYVKGYILFNVIILVLLLHTTLKLRTLTNTLV